MQKNLAAVINQKVNPKQENSSFDGETIPPTSGSAPLKQADSDLFHGFDFPEQD